jgi:signal transduction histidine kinase
MSFNAALTPITDWFIPGDLLADREMRTRARMFLISHMFGPILGNVIPAYLLWIDPKDAGKLVILASSICSFWVYPFALKHTGRYALLAFASIQNLLFAILWGCFFYGGLSSPFLPWLVTVPLLAFFYLGASVWNCITILLQITTSLTIFIALFALGGHFPQTIPLADMQGIGLISIISASIYVSMMALFYARILASQGEFEKEVRKHLETASQLRGAVSEAERASAAKADFLAKTSHELRTPLNAIIGYSQMLLEETDPAVDPQGVDDLNRIHDAGRHLLHLVDAILDLSKIEAGKMEVFVEPVDVAALLRQVANRWTSARRIAGRRISLQIEPAAGVIEADAEKLEQILDALIDNALCHAPNGDVEIAARMPKAGAGSDVVEISVADKGPGIAEALVPALFETFNSQDDVSTSKYGGAGLGLPLCHRLSALMGASLSVRTAPRVGTTVVVALPRHRRDANQGDCPAAHLAEAA